VDLFS